MKIFVNGEAVDCARGLAISELIERHGLSPETTLVERNGVALHQREWPAQKLRANDRIEILRVAAGG